MKSFFCEPITEIELSNLIYSLDVKKSSGHDNISPQIVKDNCTILAKPLLYLFNLSFEQGIVPDELKIAKVIPLFKKGDITSPANYRPISLLSIFNKLLEKLVYRRVHAFLVKNNVLYDYQFGFRKHHSTSLALMDVINGCKSNIAQQNKSIGIFFDLQKAFDTVNYNILLDKLSHCGIRGVMYKWFKDYLSNRRQFTFANHTCSKLGNIVHGVPQGSVLGPLLFLLYINDLSNVVPHNQLKMFADDINLFLYAPDLHTLEKQSNVCRANMNLWFLANRLSININKTCYTVYTGKRHVSTDYELSLYIGNQKISNSSSCKYLGVFLDENLNWKMHIDHICSKLLKFTGIFYKIRDIVPDECLKRLYFAFILPHLLFGIEVYGSATAGALDRLCKLNNRILRILLKRRRDSHVRDLYVSYHTFPVNLLYKMQVLIFVHKCLYHKNEMSVIFHNLFSYNSNIHSHHTRKRSDLHLFHASSTGNTSFTTVGVQHWNMLPSELKQYSSISLFKKRIVNYLLDTGFTHSY